LELNIAVSSTIGGSAPAAPPEVVDHDDVLVQPGQTLAPPTAYNVLGEAKAIPELPPKFPRLVPVNVPPVTLTPPKSAYETLRVPVRLSVELPYTDEKLPPVLTLLRLVADPLNVNDPLTVNEELSPKPIDDPVTVKLIMVAVVPTPPLCMPLVVTVPVVDPLWAPKLPEQMNVALAPPVPKAEVPLAHVIVDVPSEPLPPLKSPVQVIELLLVVSEMNNTVVTLRADRSVPV
jgi:hypothetical protein